MNIIVMFKKSSGRGLSCWSNVICGSPTISEIKVNFYLDFVASMYSNFFKGQTRQIRAPSFELIFLGKLGSSYFRAIGFY